MNIDFVKMHGAGNSFVFISNLSGMLGELLSSTEQHSNGAKPPPIQSPSITSGANTSIGDACANFAKKICSPQFGIGADGLVLLEQPTEKHMEQNINEEPHFAITHYNPDGSIAEFCGNALRCANLYVRQQGLLTAKQAAGNIIFATDAGNKATKNIPQKKQPCNTATVRVTMLQLDQKIKNATEDTNSINLPILPKINTATIVGRKYSYLSVGNPHAICMVEDFNFPYIHEAQQVQNSSKHFPHSTNVEYVRITAANSVEVRVVERGVGETLACGSGATAVASFIFKLRQEKFRQKIESELSNNIWQKLITLLPILKEEDQSPLQVNMLGGKLILSLTNKHIVMTGPATCAASGQWFNEDKEAGEEEIKGKD